MKVLGIISCAGALLAFGCDDTTNNGDQGGTPDNSVLRDMTAPHPDMTTTDDLTMTGGDMAVSYTGNVVLVDITGPAKIPLGDGGVTVLQVRTVAPLVGFTQVGAPADYRSMVGLTQCSANHYDQGTGDLPADDADAGEITMKGYTGGLLLNGQMAPSEIHCAIVNKRYKCGYGPLNGGMPGPDPQTAPYPSNGTPIKAGDTIQFIGAGGANIGTFDTTNMIAAKDAVLLSGANSDLTMITYDPKADTTFTFTCPTETMNKCGLTIFGVAISTNDEDPTAYTGAQTATTGGATCFGLASGGSLTVDKGTIAAMFGCDAMGNTCDAALKSVRTTIVRLDINGLSPGLKDSKGQTVLFGAGRGQFGVAAR